MKKTDVLIIGGSAAGLMAAITARRHYKDKSITLIRKENKVLIPCGIPYIYGTVGSPNNNLIPDKVLDKNNVELLIDEVKDIDRGKKQVVTASGEIVGYDKLVVAIGSEPLVPPIEGVGLDNVFVVKKDIEYLEKLKGAIDKCKNLVIVGGGFIGVEFADECRKNRDINITIVEILDNCLSLVCDDIVCSKAEEKLMEAGINIVLGRKVVTIAGDNSVEKVILDNGEELPADVVILGVGVKPNIGLAKKAGLNADDRKGIITDEYMATNDPDIYAVGDCVEKKSFFGPSFEVGRLASIATSEARVAGANLFEKRRKKTPSIGIFSTVINGLAIASAGLTEKAASKGGFDIVVTTNAAVDRHPGGMPGASELGVKLIFDKKTGVILGGQLYGGASVGELINVIGLAISHKMTAEDLATLQVGTHPALTASPIAYQLINAAEMAAVQID